MKLGSEAYPEWKVNENTINLWHMIFQNEDKDIVFLAFQKHVLESVYPPKIADIENRIHEIKNFKYEKSAAQAWAEVMKAIREFGYYQEEEALQSFDEKTRIIVKALGWQELCDSPNIAVERGQFLKMWNNIEEVSQKNEKSLTFSERMKELLSKTTKELEARKDV